jgi:hypothetical protein
VRRSDDCSVWDKGAFHLREPRQNGAQHSLRKDPKRDFSIPVMEGLTYSPTLSAVFNEHKLDSEFRFLRL